MMLMAAGCIALALTAFTDQPARKMFLLGDSISLQYCPGVRKLLMGKFTIEQKNSDSSAFKNLDVPVGSNGGDSRMVLNFLRLKIKEPDFQPDVLLLNCGLHDIKRERNSQKIAVEETEYRKNLEEIYKLVSARKIPMIWIRTTGIIDSLHRKGSGFDRYEKDVQRYNAIADEVFASHDVPEIDLFTFTEALGANRFTDHAHYIPEVRTLQAAYIVGFVELWNTGNKKMVRPN